MKKIVPDPPTSYRDPQLKAANATLRVALARQPQDPALFQRNTQAKAVTPDSLFSVRPGVSAEEALVHVALLLKCAEEVCDEITQQGSGIERGLIWSMVHSVEMARAVVEALLDARPRGALEHAISEETGRL
ncbi:MULTISPECIES: DUF6124 family protein [Pseudomonas]|uniref:DUF3077 domain-containing protein n=1 Tax=Pseudomonas protegens TaxID=380021 RepID=A0A2T6GCA5_9PSED|nr:MULTISPECIES: hypothetical protein [Pseudomonas]PUA41790.1 hypothetical protein C5U62_30340 [Pseudomonas protegens]ULT72732.1 hypothetical protein L1O02_10355 [Pseudomonas sp. BC42]BAQ82011.1 uncharacterized protein PST29_4122 [Pseudomonas sp. St29]